VQGTSSPLDEESLNRSLVLGGLVADIVGVEHHDRALMAPKLLAKSKAMAGNASVEASFEVRAVAAQIGWLENCMPVAAAEAVANVELLLSSGFSEHDEPIHHQLRVFEAYELGPVSFVTGKLNELEQRRTELSKGIDVKSGEQHDLLSRESRYQQSKEEIRQLVDRLQSPANEELFKLRAQIASQMKILVQILFVASVGGKPRLEASIERLRGVAGKQGVVAHMRRAAAHPDRSQRYFAVAFRDSNVRVVYPSDDDPLQFKQQVVASEASGFEVLRPESATL
jgi:hypothetical protein